MAISGQGDQWLKRFVPYLLYRITNQLTHRIRNQLRRAGINVGRWRVLSALQAYGSVNMKRIAELTVMEQSTVSRIVTQLEREGLAVREVSKADSRFVHVRLTAAGQKAFASIYPTAKRHQQVALTGFSRQDVRMLIRFLDRMQKNIEDED